jgi:hypothetical protein
MLREMDDFRKQQLLMSACVRAGTALTDMNRAVTLLFVQIQTAVAAANEAVLWCNALTNSSVEVLHWIAPTRLAAVPATTDGQLIETRKPGPPVAGVVASATEPSKRSALPTCSTAARHHVASLILAITSLINDANKGFGEAREGLAGVVESCEFLLDAAGRLRHAQSTSLFSLAHGAATLLRDIRTLGAVLSEESARFYSLTVPPSADNATEPPSVDETLCHMFPHLMVDGRSCTNASAGLQHATSSLLSCRQGLEMMSAVVGTIRMAVGPLVPSLEVLRQALNDHQAMIRFELSKNDQDISTVDAALQEIQSRAVRAMVAVDESPSSSSSLVPPGSGASGGTLNPSSSLPNSSVSQAADSSSFPSSSSSPATPALSVRQKLAVAASQAARIVSVVAHGEEGLLPSTADLEFVAEVLVATVEETAALNGHLSEVLASRLPLDADQTVATMERFEVFGVAMNLLCPIVLS